MSIPIIGQESPEIPILEEQVPIPLDKLAAVKQKLTTSEELSNRAAQVGITVVKVLAAATQVGMQAEQLEAEIRLDLREIIVSVGVKPEEFKGFDFDKGVIRIQRGGTGDTGSTGQGA